jgi:hypothetical protein
MHCCRDSVLIDLFWMFAISIMTSAARCFLILLEKQELLSRLHAFVFVCILMVQLLWFDGACLPSARCMGTVDSFSHRLESDAFHKQSDDAH